MNINNFYEEFMLELKIDASHNCRLDEDEFLEKQLLFLEEIGEFNDPLIYNFETTGKRRRIMKFDAYCYDEADKSLIFITSDFSNTNGLQILTNSKIESIYKRMHAFIDEVCNGNLIEYCDDSDPILKVGKEIYLRFNSTNMDRQLNKIKFYIISNSMLSTRVKSLKKESFNNKPVEVNVWSFDRFFDMMQTANSEPIKINVKDYGINGIPCIKADLKNEDDYSAYLAIVPGKFLADIYLDYGSKLLEGNVRAFLSNRGKVNKGIRSTIKNEATRFFTYNNGIATTADKITLENNEITFMEDLQIINGGQTTASLASALINKDSKDLKDIFVPMKLTVVKRENEKQIENYNDMIQLISRYANSQNSVKASDFFSNHPFHRRMEKLSLKTPAPPVNGSPSQTIWYYERSRGKYNQEQLKLSKSKRVKFKNKFPKNQVLTKEKLAKYLNAYNCLPHIVSQGSNKSMNYFAKEIVENLSKDINNINDSFFKKAVCAAIIFTNVDRMILKQPWYSKGGYKLNIVPYTISKIISAIPKGKSVDLQKIWKNQSIYPTFTYEVERVSKITNDFILEKSNGMIVTEFCKKENAWKLFKNYEYKLSNKFLNDLIDVKELKVEEDRSKKTQKLENETNIEIEVYNLGSSLWKHLLLEAEPKNLLSPKELDILAIGAKMEEPPYKTPSISQCKILMKIKEKLRNEGII